MNDLSATLASALEDAAHALRTAGLPGEVSAQLLTLMEQLDQPCVVAVVGRVKAGKSTFVNALLGEDLAKVGATESTATINYFRYGRPNPDRPIRCYWRNGQVTDESRAFLDSLQGSDIEVLRRADAILRLEYCLTNRYLEHVTIVDTPGLGSAVDDHQNRTAELLGLAQQIRDRAIAESVRLQSEADAVLYLFGSVARANDRELLRELQEITHGQVGSHNAIGIMTKIDLHSDILSQRQALATEIQVQLRDIVNTVIPVTAEVERFRVHLADGAGEALRHLADSLRRIPRHVLSNLLELEELYLRPHPDCPLSVDERKTLMRDISWRAFVTTATVVADPGLDISTIDSRLRDLSGFERVVDVLERRLFRRARLLRQYGVVERTRHLIATIEKEYVRTSRQQSEENRARRARFLAFIGASGGDLGVARELESFVCNHLAERPSLEPMIQRLKTTLAQIRSQLESHREDYDALQKIDDHRDLFSSQEVDELLPLLGLHGAEVERRLPPGRVDSGFINDRAMAWRAVELFDPYDVRRDVGRQAERRYRYLGDELRERSHT